MSTFNFTFSKSTFRLILLQSRSQSTTFHAWAIARFGNLKVCSSLANSDFHKLLSLLTGLDYQIQNLQSYWLHLLFHQVINHQSFTLSGHFDEKIINLSFSVKPQLHKLSGAKKTANTRYSDSFFPAIVCLTASIKVFIDSFSFFEDFALET